MTIIGLGLCVTHFSTWPTALGQYILIVRNDDGHGRTNARRRRLTNCKYSRRCSTPKTYSHPSIYSRDLNRSLSLADKDEMKVLQILYRGNKSAQSQLATNITIV